MNMRNIVLCILYLFLVPMGGFAQSEVVVLYPDTENKDLDEAVYQKIFLAGTIDMGKSVDWQKATCDWFRALPEGRYLLFNPRRDKGLSGEMSVRSLFGLKRLCRNHVFILSPVISGRR